MSRTDGCLGDNWWMSNGCLETWGSAGPMFLSVSLCKACLKSFSHYVPIFRMDIVGFIFCEVVFVFSESCWFLKGTWYYFFYLGWCSVLSWPPFFKSSELRVQHAKGSICKHLFETCFSHSYTVCGISNTATEPVLECCFAIFSLNYRGYSSAHHIRIFFLCLRGTQTSVY